MAKFAIFLEQDDAGKDTGRFQVAEEGDDFVLDTFDTEKEAEKYMKKLQTESDRDDKINAEYLEWEKGCMKRHKIKRNDLRVYLVNVVCV
jgi:hypothetical protein